MWYRLCHTSSHAKKVSANRRSLRRGSRLSVTLRGGKVGNTGRLSWPRMRWGLDRFSRRDQEQLVETRIPQSEQWGIGSQPPSTAIRVKLSVLFLVTLRCDVGIIFHCWSVRLCHACSYWIGLSPCLLLFHVSRSEVHCESLDPLLWQSFCKPPDSDPRRRDGRQERKRRYDGYNILFYRLGPVMPNFLACGDCSMEPLPHPAQETLSSVGQSSGQ